MDFPVNSRYHAIETAKWRDPDDREIIYLRRRFIPIPKKSSALTEHTITQDERLDNITARYLGDPEQFWRLCDANNAVKPTELTSTIGRRLLIPVLEGF
jgi:hypothetical protein